MATKAAYGTWKTPIDARTVARHAVRPGWVSAGADALWWTESRPAEDGRVILVRRRSDRPAEAVLSRPWSVRSRVHEYGGRSYVVLPDGGVVFSESSDQRLYRFDLDVDPPRPLSPIPAVPAGLRYVEPLVAPTGEEIWCIRERHCSDDPTDVERAIVAVPLDGRAAQDPAAVRVIAEDRHFLACPSISPDGSMLAWLTWDHPSMPWDSTELRVASIGPDGRAGRARTLAGGPEEAVVQVAWSDVESGTLLAVTDPGGWWNLHRIRIASTASETVNLYRREEEFGGALWQLGMRWFAPLSDGRIATIHGRGTTCLGILDPSTGELTDVDSPYTEWAATLTTYGDRVVGIAASPDRPYRPVEVDPATGECHEIATAQANPGVVDAEMSPRPEARTFHGVDHREVHAHLYPPRNPHFAAPTGELPPYVVFVHGGPTGRTPMVYDLETAYFTSRGIGVVEVNYGGSTGYGREYRNRLRESWGVVDVEDCVAVAEALAAEGLADPARLAIRGGSAGGWTTASALTSVGLFGCGTIRYPILDLAGWRTGETHDFESRYLESLVGPWPETRRRYDERSPVNRADNLSAPFLLLQGLDDEICPPAQCERFLERIAGREIPHAYLTFEGEQHGFRKEETIVAALEAELSLYGRVFGFEPYGVDVSARKNGDP